MKTIFPNRLKELRIEKELTQEKLGKVFHVSRATIYHWENGVQEPCISLLMDIAKFFEISLDDLCGM